jgi:hypothetical protein
MTLPIHPAFRPVLDPGFIPAVLWNRAYRAKVKADPGARILDLALTRCDGTTFRWSGPILSPGGAKDALTIRYIERHVKFLLWQKGGSRLMIAGAPEVAEALSRIYSEPANVPSTGVSSAPGFSASRSRSRRSMPPIFPKPTTAS